MSVDSKIIRTGYYPRPGQDLVHRELERFNVLVMHRRWGKTVFSINHMIHRAITNKKRNPTYAYIAPTHKQAKRIAWQMLKDYTKNIPGVSKNEQDLIVTIRFANRDDTIKIMLLGAENPDSIRGIYLDGVIMDEFAQCDPTIWTQTVRPMLTDRLGWAIFIGCVVKNTLIIGENGLEEIGVCSVGYTNENKQVYGLGGFHKAENRYGNKKLKTKKIKTKSGLELEATPNHQIWTPSGWVRMDKLTVGQPVYMQYNQGVYGKEHCDDNFAYFLGLYLAEGCCEKSIYRITITSGDDEIHSFLEENFGFKKCDKLHARLNSKEFFNYLQSWFPDIGEVRAVGKSLSNRILKLNRRSMRLFLSGYFDGDGTCHKNKQMVGCVTSSEKLARQLQCLLLNMGYRASRSSVLTEPTKKVKVSSVGHRIEINGTSAYFFAKEIGFKLTRKQNRTKSWTEKRGHLYWFDRSDFGKLTSKDGYLGRCRKVLQKKLIEIDPNEKYDLSLLADEISFVGDSEAETFDFCIPETHSYFSNGLISHNTPKGRNHFFKIYEAAKKAGDHWYTKIFKASETGLIPANELEDALLTSSKEEYDQEYECSFSAALIGSYYGSLMDAAESENRITNVPHDPALPVDTFWDLGIKDSTAIWFLQEIGQELHVIDYIEENGKGLDFYVKALRDGHRARYNYRDHVLPHDGKARELGSGKTRQETLRNLGIRTHILNRQSVDDGIHAVRMILPKCWFDAVKCEDGINALRNYEKDWDSKMQMFKSKPKHNWASNGADAFRYLALGQRPESLRSAVKDLPRLALDTDYDILGEDDNWEY